jgi:hypothetical protein
VTTFYGQNTELESGARPAVVNWFLVFIMSTELSCYLVGDTLLAVRIENILRGKLNPEASFEKYVFKFAA